MYKILVVDDEPDFRDTLRGRLSDEGHTVRVASNEGQALDAVIQEPFDFALIDVRLHEGGEEDESGSSLAMAFRALDPKVHVILLTRYVRAKQIVRAIRYLGVEQFVEKTPDVVKQVLEIIAETRDRPGICDEPREPQLKNFGDESRLSLSLVARQHLAIRSRGYHVCSRRSGRALVLDVERYARRTEVARQDWNNLRLQVEQIGRDLWRDVFGEQPEAKETYLTARASSQLLSLQFETPREYVCLPMEFMYSDAPQEYLVLQHPLARFVCEATPKREAISPRVLALTKELRVLIIASNTTSKTLPPIDGADAEAQELSSYLKGQDRIPVDVKLIATEQATYERVRAELKAQNYDVVHYAGHGSYEADSPEESSLYFWAEADKQGGIVPMRATEVRLLLGQSGVRLVYLSSCYGTASGGKVALLDDDFLGLADAVAQAGVPSVVGYRWPVSDDGARRLALAFYKSLLDQGRPEVALWHARCELSIDRNDTTWLSPILIHQV